MWRALSTEWNGRWCRSDTRAALRGGGALAAVIGLAVADVPVVAQVGALVGAAALAVREVRAERQRQQGAARSRLDDLEHRHASHLEQSRLLRNWVVRQQQFLDGVVSSIQAGVIAVNADATVTTSNRAADHVLGVDALRVGHRINADAGPLQRLLADAIAGRQPPAEEIEVCGSDGVDRRLSVDARPVPGRDGETIGAVAALHDVTHLRSAAEEMERRALQDGLTGLPNRTLLDDRLERAVARASRNETEVAVLFMDLDGFKSVNDTYGHEAGDTVLQVIARRLLHTIRPDDTVARFGGDEFVVVCEGKQVDREAAAIASRIIERVADPILLPHDEVAVGCSIGIAIGDASSGGSALLSSADEAMYRAKQHRGPERVEVTDQRTRVVAATELMETELHQAILRHELNLEYQPITDLATGEMVGVEALVRWDHPVRGRLGPADFLPIAERSGLIVPMGRALLAEACSLVAPAGAADDRPLLLHVNVSARQLLDRRLEQKVLAELERSGMRPRDLCLEIREQDLVTLTTRAAASIRALATAGVRFAVDDFGSGPASVTGLRRHPIHVVKIDRSQVAAMTGDGEHESFVRAVVHLASNLGLHVVAEGVETDEQRARLVELGCEMGQGYLFARPMPAENLCLTADERAAVRSAP